MKLVKIHENGMIYIEKVFFFWGLGTQFCANIYRTRSQSTRARMKLSKMHDKYRFLGLVTQILAQIYPARAFKARTRMKLAKMHENCMMYIIFANLIYKYIEMAKIQL